MQATKFEWTDRRRKLTYGAAAGAIGLALAFGPLAWAQEGAPGAPEGEEPAASVGVNEDDVDLRAKERLARELERGERLRESDRRTLGGFWVNDASNVFGEDPVGVILYLSPMRDGYAVLTTFDGTQRAEATWSMSDEGITFAPVPAGGAGAAAPAAAPSAIPEGPSAFAQSAPAAFGGAGGGAPAAAEPEAAPAPVVPGGPDMTGTATVRILNGSVFLEGALFGDGETFSRAGARTVNAKMASAMRAMRARESALDGYWIGELPFADGEVVVYFEDIGHGGAQPRYANMDDRPQDPYAAVVKQGTPFRSKAYVRTIDGSLLYELYAMATQVGIGFSVELGASPSAVDGRGSTVGGAYVANVSASSVEFAGELSLRRMTADEKADFVAAYRSVREDAIVTRMEELRETFGQPYASPRGMPPVTEEVEEAPAEPEPVADATTRTGPSAGPAATPETAP